MKTSILLAAATAAIAFATPALGWTFIARH
jgi:hypothetical protein